jgi:hypothetical protein
MVAWRAIIVVSWILYNVWYQYADIVIAHLTNKAVWITKFDILQSVLIVKLHLSHECCKISLFLNKKTIKEILASWNYYR